MAFDAAGLSNDGVVSASRKTLASEFNVDKEWVTANASESRRLLEENGQEYERQLQASQGGNWAVYFEVRVPSENHTAASAKVIGFQADASALAAALTAELVSLGELPQGASLAINVFAALEVLTTTVVSTATAGITTATSTEQGTVITTATSTEDGTTAEAVVLTTSAVPTTTTNIVLVGYTIESGKLCQVKQTEQRIQVPLGENLELFCARTCNSSDTCVGFVNRASTDTCDLRLGQMYAPIPRDDYTCYVRIGFSSARVTMTVENMEHSVLVANKSLFNEFVDRVKNIVATKAGNGATPNDVEVKLSPGSIIVDAAVHSYAGLKPTDVHQALSASTNLSTELAQNLQSIPGIGSVSTGSITVSNLQVVHQSDIVAQSLAAKDSDDFDWALFAVVVGLLALFAFSVCVCVLKLTMRHKKYENDEKSHTFDQEGSTQGSKDSPETPQAATQGSKDSPETPQAEHDRPTEVDINTGFIVVCMEPDENLVTI
jgi:hypothetical protein